MKKTSICIYIYYSMIESLALLIAEITLAKKAEIFFGFNSL